MSNRKRTLKTGERVVVFVCTGRGAEVHSRRKVGVVTVRNGEAVEVGTDKLRRAITARDIKREAPGVEMSPFDFYCSRCGRHFQSNQEKMREAVTLLLAARPDNERVPIDLRRF